ncbi:MAG: UDP-N-acetylmuramoyl-L-alanyl-D-glutamate--2,6-diaminopimelate ligase [Acidimicrobiaceae bacterium]|nr:UDP-N-acetylmuramoyl-L-alanyl-D-glutamate--2,6-diaminopimelate ligase [Acidimicrobiaceae bacterium]
MRLDRLVEGIPVVELPAGAGHLDVRAITMDSRAVTTGALFFCVPGERADGHDFAATAVEAGATALLVERRLAVDVPQVLVGSVRAAMPTVAANFHDWPSRSMAVVGVTGTNGKTTPTHLLAAIFEANGWRPGIIGTLSGARTTPEAPELQGRLAELRDSGHQAVAMEVSSHALVQHRADAVHFRVAVFTNLSQDHLDYHRTMDDYYEAKRRLFEPSRTETAVVNADDEWGRRLLAEIDVPSYPFEQHDAEDLMLSATGSRFRWREAAVELPIPGRFNVANALAAATAAAVLGIPVAAIAQGLSAVTTVPGRFERVDAGQPFTVIVDYAHTPDALEQLLTAARELAAPDHRLAVVFGCGGDRDHAKRPLMGAVAARLADRAYLTSDNPRREDPLSIIDEVRAGVADPSRLVVEPDRGAAIAMALHDARSGDVVVIAGKGHETGQDVGGVVTPFDDRIVARHVLEETP